MRSFARSWILDLKGRGIRVNVLSPGHISTPGLDVLLDEKEQAGLVAKILLDRIGTPDDIAGTAVFPASDDSAYVTGVELMVDGGVALLIGRAPILRSSTGALCRSCERSPPSGVPGRRGSPRRRNRDMRTGRVRR